MTRGSAAGFTIVEVLVAVMILSIGVLALLGSSAAVSRMLGEGRAVTEATQVATARLERLRQVAAGSTPPCGTLASSAGPVTTGRVRETWTVSGTGTSRTLTANAVYGTRRGDRTVTLSTTIRC